jgi:interferon-induced GTP-binding protein Mx1
MYAVASQVLLNRRKPLKHGYFMLKNRSQESLKSNIPLDKARKDEMAYFESSPYTQAGTGRLGVNALSATLTELLVERIKDAIPELQLEVQKALDEAQASLKELGEAPPDTPKERRLAANAIVRDIVRDLRQVFAQVDSFSEESDGKPLTAPSRLTHILLAVCRQIKL